MVGVDEAGDLLAASGARVLGEVPPGLGGGMAVEHDFGPALTVDGSVAHDGGAGGAAGGDEWMAAGEGVADQAAGAFGELVVFGIARGVEGDGLVDEQSDAGAELDGADEECGVGGVGGEFDGVGFGAVVEGLLDASGVEEGAAVNAGFDLSAGGLGGGEGCVQRDAGGRDDGLGDLAQVLRVEQRRRRRNESCERDPQHPMTSMLLRQAHSELFHPATNRNKCRQKWLRCKWGGARRFRAVL